MAKTRTSKTGLQFYEKRPQFRVQEWAGYTFCYHVGRRGRRRATGAPPGASCQPLRGLDSSELSVVSVDRAGLPRRAAIRRRGSRGRKLCRSRLHDRRKLLLEGSVIMIRMVGRPAVRGLLRRRADPLTRVPCFKSKLLALRSRAHI